jgi:hypothetical protein
MLTSAVGPVIQRILVEHTAPLNPKAGSIASRAPPAPYLVESDPELHAEHPSLAKNGVAVA